MKKITTTFLICFIVFSGLSQSNDTYQNEKRIIYDDWPVTVESNAIATQSFKFGTTRFVPIGTVWDHRIITYFFQNGTTDIAGDIERQAIRDGFALWSAQTNLYFLETCFEEEADIVFLWGAFNHGDEGPFDGVGGVLAHTLGGPPPNDFGDQAGDIHFDESETWTLNTRSSSSQPIDLVTVAAHEIGHALGLNHTTVSGSLMMEEYTGSHRFLGSDDIAGVQNLYGVQHTSNIPVSGPSIVCSAGASFTVENPGDSISWNYGGYITQTSPQGSNPCIFTATGSGETWIEATIYTACDAVTLHRYEVYAGQLPTPVITGPATVKCGYDVTFSVDATNAENGDSFYWDSDVVSIISGRYSPQCTVSGTDPAMGGYISCRVTACGVNKTGSKNINVIGCPFLLLSPNPATSETLVSIENASEEERLGESAEWELEVSDQNQMLITKKTKLKGSTYTLNTTGWHEGLYLVRANYKGELLTEKLMVKK